MYTEDDLIGMEFTATGSHYTVKSITDRYVDLFSDFKKEMLNHNQPVSDFLLRINDGSYKVVKKGEPIEKEEDSDRFLFPPISKLKV